VVVAGVVSAGIELVATMFAGGGEAGLLLSSLLPVFFVAYWLLDAWLVDAGAGLSGSGGRRREYMAVSGLAFLSLIAYALLSLLEAAAARWSGNALASALGWLTLPALAWFVALMVLAINAVYGVPALNAFALALLPFAAIATALLLTAIVLSVLHALRVI